MPKLKTKNQNFKREFSAGCVVYRQLTTNNKQLTTEFLLGKHSGYHKWVLPKGLIEEEESGGQTALRETEEEMGVKTRLVTKKSIHRVQYIFYADYKPQSEISNSQFLISKSRQKSRSDDSRRVESIETLSEILGESPGQIPNPKSQKSRRVEKYQEEEGRKIKVFKTVSFYLTEYVSGDPKNHGWEMEGAGWFGYEKALKLLAFKGEKEALKKAKEILKKGAQERLF